MEDVFQFPGPSDRSAWIHGLRPDHDAVRRTLDVDRPAGCAEELEPDSEGRLNRVMTVFLTNRECPWRCLMCDLWKHTTLESTPLGAIPGQIQSALSGASNPDWIKLYNSGSFFDPRAIPVGDHGQIANLVSPFRRVIVECHPRLVGPGVAGFADRIKEARLEVALGLESAHPVVLERLNKGMSVDDFNRAAAALRQAGVDVRAFVLIKPPFLNDNDAVEWAIRSAAVAFTAGAGVVSLIPTRLGNGALEELARHGHFAEPRLELIEETFDRALALKGGRVFADLWDLERFGAGQPYFQQRKARLAAMNLEQRILPRIVRS